MPQFLHDLHQSANVILAYYHGRKKKFKNDAAQRRPQDPAKQALWEADEEHWARISQLRKDPELGMYSCPALGRKLTLKSAGCDPI
jgi:hypothetical protein